MEMRMMVRTDRVDLPERTQYGIQHTVSGLWLTETEEWDDRDHAHRFEFMTFALAHAMWVPGLDPETFSVEAV